MKLLLTAISGSREGKTFTIEDKQCITFGRTGASNWSFEDDGHMSSIHFEVENLGSRAEVRDRGSTNGTWLNNQKIARDARETLREGDRIRAGKTILTVEFYKELVPAVIVREEEVDQTLPPTPVTDILTTANREPDIEPYVRPQEEHTAAPVLRMENTSRPRASNPFDSVDFEKMESAEISPAPPAKNYDAPFHESNRRAHSPISDSSFSFGEPQFESLGGPSFQLLARRTSLESADGLAIVLDSLATKWSVQLVVHFPKIRISTPRECRAEPIFKNSPFAVGFEPVRITWNESNMHAILPLMPRLCRADACIAFLGQSAPEIATQISTISGLGMEGFSEQEGLFPFFWPSTLMAIVDARGAEVCQKMLSEQISGAIMCSPWSRHRIVAVANDALTEDLHEVEFQLTERIIGE